MGLPGAGRRRVPGLRRAEVAQLAGVSVDYCTRLDQGRTPSVSDAVLDAIARVLRLDEVEHGHLRDLSRPHRKAARPPGAERLRPGLRHGVKLLRHPVVGDLDLGYEMIPSPRRPRPVPGRLHPPRPAPRPPRNSPSWRAGRRMRTDGRTGDVAGHTYGPVAIFKSRSSTRIHTAGVRVFPPVGGSRPAHHGSPGNLRIGAE
ncbi:helix-turn-helix domain-containing protein [Streptomyces sp. G5(2025)]|uniref:helix-turn-helix domain-containing protein n=1 Tax=Streptomyces sp. G5(2025) TaxID=3406628 RepID=UPI003C1FCAA5